jgi:hypothetical protein
MLSPWGARLWLIIVAAILISLYAGWIPGWNCSSRADCDVAFDCAHGKLTINTKTYRLVCARHTARGIEGGEIGHLIKADGPWRPGLVAPGTPMITTHPQLCYDCFIHVTDDFSFSNGCLGTTQAAFNLLKTCGGSKFTITTK